MNRAIEPLLGWLDSFATEKHEPMELSKFLSYTTFDVVGEIVFSKQFGFISEGKDIGNAIENSLALNAYM